MYLYLPCRIIIRPVEWNIVVIIIIGSCSPPHRANSSLQASALVASIVTWYRVPLSILLSTHLLFDVRIRHPEGRRRAHYKRIMIA